MCMASVYFTFSSGMRPKEGSRSYFDSMLERGWMLSSLLGCPAKACLGLWRSMLLPRLCSLRCRIFSVAIAIILSRRSCSYYWYKMSAFRRFRLSFYFMPMLLFTGDMLLDIARDFSGDCIELSREIDGRILGKSAILRSGTC